MQPKSALDMSGKESDSQRQIVFVAGMHRSATSAFAGSLALLGVALPARMPDANIFNPKGYFEPENVVRANDRLLGAMQRHWSDCRPVIQPENAERQAAEDHFTRLIEKEFGPGQIVALKDPRVSLLAPIWIDAALRTGARPSLVVMLRDPVAAAASIMRRDGLGDETAIALWLRYMLDAEYHSRGQARIILGTEEFVRNPVATLERVGVTLGLPWPTAPEAARAEITDLIDTSLLDAWEDVQTPLADFASEVHAALHDLAAQQGADDAEALGRIDRLRADFDAKCPELHARSVFDQLGKSVTLKWENDAANRALRGLEATVGELRAQGESARAELREQGESTRAELENARNAVAALTAQNQGLTGQLAQAMSDIVKITMNLTLARRRPLKILRDLIKFKVLRGLSKASPPLPSRMAQRFGRSAAKRDPNRTFEIVKHYNAPEGTQMAIPVSVTSNVARYTGRAERVPGRPDILIVSHDASRTGAPILTLNLVQNLSRRYNVTTLCLSGGALLNDFQAHSVGVWEAAKFRGGERFYTDVLDDILPEHSFAFAIVNSIESRYMLQPLKLRKVPSVALLHEFASWTYPKTAFRDAISVADNTVFSTRLTLENAVESNHLTRSVAMHVFPQGKCVAPGIATLPGASQTERDRLKRLLRPEGVSDNRFIVLGAGYVHIRKGVDLFIDMATRVIARPETKDVLFVWVGEGFDRIHDMAYSVFLQDQMNRAGVSGRVIMLDATPEIDTLYELSDALVVTSRLDPLPNVAIDAMTVGLPVLCFEQTTGIADTLADAGLHASCVSPYLDTHDMAEKLTALATSKGHYSIVSERTRIHAEEVFDFDAYVEKIEDLALSGDGHLESDVDIIIESGSFQPTFCAGQAAKGMDAKDVVRGHCESIRHGVFPRKPEPGFHPYVFASHRLQGLARDTNPYAEFLRQGRPDGIWMSPVITGGSSITAIQPTSLRTALHIHAFYTDQLKDIAQRLATNSSHPDLFISVGDAAGEQAARQHLLDYAGTLVSVDVVPNIGRDIGPLLTRFGSDLVRDYDVIGHIHTKKSTHVKNVDVINAWTSFSYSGTIGDMKHKGMMDLIFDSMQKNIDIGVVYPDDPNIIGWTENRIYAEKLAHRMGIESLPHVFNFPVGTMFWMRSAALKPFVDLGLTWSDYPCEPLPNDGTMLHAFERLFGIVPQMQGWKTAVTNTPGISR